MITSILLTLLALAVGVTGGILWVRVQLGHAAEAAQHEADRIRRRTGAEVEAIRREGEARARELALETRSALERERSAAEDELGPLESRVAELDELLTDEEAERAESRAALAEREAAVQKDQDRSKSIHGEAKALLKKCHSLLQELAGQTDEECLAEQATALVDRAKAESADRLRNLETEPDAAAVRQAKRIMGIALGRLDKRHPVERQTWNVEVDAGRRKLLEDDPHGILKAVEETTGVKINWINDGGSVRIETGNGPARVAARRGLEKILTQRATEPEKVAKILANAQNAVQGEIVARGRRAFKKLRLPPAAPELTELVGRLYFRTSYTQNQWEHVMESAYLAGLMAAELELDVKLARRATVLHDIGKALTHEIDGSHALIGGELAEKHGESAEVVGGIAEHHNEKPASSVYTLLVAASDAISGARPGARRELVETYGERIAVLEDLASRFNGVTQVHAVQAGREIRVLVDEKKVSDERAANLATEIATKIGEELTFPGQIQVTVIREFSAMEYAN